MTVQFIDNALALQSLRDSDFDVYSAYGEVIDNSIQAEASWVKIHFETERSHSKKPYFKIKEVIFSDNGKGMDKETLHRCMQMGFSSRYNDRSGIGRFGVGMTLASINQCKRVEVYSRDKNEGAWLWTYVDLDEITTQTADGIPEPVTKQLPEEYNKIASDGTGTIVLWKKYDRQPESADTIITETCIWTGRTYRYFIWEGFSIHIDDQVVKAIDPLYVRTEKTNFPDDPPAEELEPIVLNWKVPHIDRAAESPDESPITIRFSILPEALRSYRGVGGADEAKKRCINRNEGFSIIRNKREVFYGHIPYYQPKFDEKDRWWGCEISFNAVLDRAFTVKNIKRGALPCTELRELIQEKVNPTRKTAIKKVTDFWDRVAAKANQQVETGQLITGHEEAELVAKKTITPKNTIDVGKNPQDEADAILQNMEDDIDEIEKQQWKTRFSDQPFTIKDETWKGSDFFETAHLGGNDVLKYNKLHPFFKELDEIISQIEQAITDDENGSLNKRLYKKLKCLIDLLIISYSKAEGMLPQNEKMSSNDFIETQRFNWGEYLKRYLNTWKNNRDE